MSKRLRGVGAGLIFALALACAKGTEIPEYIVAEDAASQESTPLGGEALAQRKHEMERAHRDMIHFATTMESLHGRHDRNGLVLFSGFLDRYMGEHIGPLLLSEWQSRHPELMVLDVNLRFAQAEVLIQMRDARRVQHVIEEIERRYTGREDMLVEYPIGSQGTLLEGLQRLRNRKWRG